MLNLEEIQKQALGDKLPTSLGVFIGNILPYIFGAAGIALLIYLILGGFQLMLSRGDPKAIQAAQAKITNAVIGFVLVIFAFLIVVIIARIFGLAVWFSIFGRNVCVGCDVPNVPPVI